MALKLSHVSKYLRPAVQAVCLIVAAYLFVNIGEATVRNLANAAFLADPIMAISSILFYRGTWFPILISMCILIAGSYLLGRAFCGWVCPVGFLVDLSGIISKFISKVIKRKTTTRRFGLLQYGILSAVVLLSFISMQALSILDPFVIFRRSVFMVMNAGIPEVLLVILLASIVIAPRFFCRAICPVGAIIGLSSLISPFKFKTNDGCVHCKKCQKVCSMGAISKDMKWDATACIKCLDCERHCPKKTISFSFRRSTPPAMAPPTVTTNETSLSRRSLLSAGAVLGLFAVTKGTVSAQSILPGQEAGASSASPLIRPPGALVEDKFNAACVRCHACLSVCPVAIIEPAGFDKGFDKVYTPVLNFSKNKCVFCGKCGEVCPNGTLIKLPRSEIKIGTAVINEKTCYAWDPDPSTDRTCMQCKKVCKYDAVSSTGDYRPIVNVEACTGCGACEQKCPVKEKAIVVTNAGEKRREV